MIEKKKQQLLNSSGKTESFRTKMTKKEGDIFWDEVSRIRYKVWCDGGYVQLFDPINAKKDQFVISLKLFGGQYLEEFVVQRWCKYGEKDIARVDPRAQQALRDFLIEIGFYKG